jgi:hypothetical protein
MRGLREKELALELHRAGVHFHVELEAAGGSRSFELTVQDVGPFLDDPDGWAARQWGVPRSVYLEWKQAGGFPQCVANTRSGRRCRNGVVGPPDERGMVDPPEFARLVGGYCHVHGG